MQWITSGRARPRACQRMTVSTGLTMFFLPALYSRLFRIGAAHKAKQKRSESQKRRESMLEMTESAVEIPPHVPAEFVREYPIVQGRYVDEDPYKTIIPAIHQWPPVFYATNAYPGSTPAWVLRRAADVREAYKRSEERRVGKEGGSTCRSRWCPE